MRTAMEEKLKALIVDDEADVCFLLSSILRNSNLQAVFVNSLTDAKKKLEEYDPAIIFLDNHLPDGFGINFISEIRKYNPGIKIVMITAYDTASDREKAYSEGIDQFIGKPFTRDAIFAALEKLVN